MEVIDLLGGGYPKLVQADMGTENVTVRDIQLYLQRNDEHREAGE